VVEYLIDEAAREMTLTWQWTEPDWFETTMGDVEDLASGHVLVSMAHGECFSSNRGDVSTYVEVDPVSGDKVWDARFARSEQMSYRGDPADACALFANAKYCPALRDRLGALALP
jgi:hypothetical protein